MHIGILAAAANNSPFTIFYNPRASPAGFVIPLAKYNKAMYAQVSLGMRFRMMFETEESGVRRYMATITSISLDATRWKSSQCAQSSGMEHATLGGFLCMDQDVLSLQWAWLDGWRVLANILMPLCTLI